VKFGRIAAAEHAVGAVPRAVQRQDATRWYRKRMEFTEEGWRSLADHARERQLLFLSSPFSIEAVDRSNASMPRGRSRREKPRT
jgi:N-acetylneuraminate synthase